MSWGCTLPLCSKANIGALLWLRTLNTSASVAYVQILNVMFKLTGTYLLSMVFFRVCGENAQHLSLVLMAIIFEFYFFFFPYLPRIFIFFLQATVIYLHVHISSVVKKS